MRLKLWAAFAATSLVGVSLVHVPEARADKGDRFGNSEESGRKGADKAEKSKDKDKDKGGKRIALSPEGLKFGMSLDAIAKLYDKTFDTEFLALYKKASPGPETDALDAELRQKKGEIRRSKVEFGQTPTGVDQTPLKGEYSYANGETMARLTLKSGTERYFFFFSDKLWKVIDVHKLKEGGPLGGTYDEAAKKLGQRLGGAGKKVPPKPDAGQNFPETHWQTVDMVIRAIDRGDMLAVAWVDREIQEKLPSMRRNKPKDQHAMDPDVAAALKKKDPPPDPKDEKKDAKSKKK